MKINPLRSNQTELIFDDGAKVLFSYETPVAAYVQTRLYKDLEEVESNDLKACQ